MGGIVFASQLEASLYHYLLGLERLGEISNIKVQPKIYFTNANILYRPDFSFEDMNSKETVFAEAKGFETGIWKIKKRLWKFYGPGKLKIYMQKNQSIYLDETLDPSIKITIKRTRKKQDPNKDS